jgi:hypothetical protein
MSRARCVCVYVCIYIYIYIYIQLCEQKALNHIQCPEILREFPMAMVIRPVHEKNDVWVIFTWRVGVTNDESCSGFAKFPATYGKHLWSTYRVVTLASLNRYTCCHQSQIYCRKAVTLIAVKEASIWSRKPPNTRSVMDTHQCLRAD